MSCSCGSELNYADCCEPIIDGRKEALTAESLMRARYSGHVKSAFSFLERTLAAEKRKDYDEASAKEWASKSEWLGLQILSTKKGMEADKSGIVEFIAKYKSEGKIYEHHETSEFRRGSRDGKWYFYDGESHTHEEGKGHHHSTAPKTRETPKIGRNDPCSCGSGKKFKKCCDA